MTRPSRRFEDLAVGERRRSETYTVTRDEMLDFASRNDPQWFHADAKAAAASEWGDVIASGVQVLAIWRRLDHAINGDIDFVCGIGFDEFRLKTALRAGDTVFVESEILSLEPSASGKPRGTAITAYALRRADGAEILTFRSINLVRSRAAPG